MSFPGARQLGIRGPATGIRKLGLMTGPENGPTATPTPTPTPTPSQTVTFSSTGTVLGSNGIANIWDNNPSTYWALDSAGPAGNDIADILIDLGAASSVAEVKFTSAPAPAGGVDFPYTPTQLFYSDTGTSGPWTQWGTDQTMPYPVDSGASATAVFGNGSGAHRYWKVHVKTPFGNNLYLGEIELHATVGGTTDLLG